MGAQDEIDRAAARVQKLADEARGLAGRVDSAGRADWQSLAAESFRRRLAGESARIRCTADQLDAAALALRRHAAAVHEAVARLRIGRWP